MPPRRRIPLHEGRSALAAWLAGDRGTPTVATAVRYSLEELGERAPGGSIEVRVPPHAAIQCGEGSRHTRGTPPRVIETDSETWLSLVTGELTWADAVATGRLRASGTGVSLEAWLPLEGITAHERLD